MGRLGIIALEELVARSPLESLALPRDYARQVRSQHGNQPAVSEQSVHSLL